MQADKIHILQVVHSLVIGGTERVVCDLVRSCNNDYFSTSVCCLDTLGEFGQDLIDEGYDVDVLQRRPGVDFNLVGQLRHICRTRKIHLMHAHQYTPYFYAACASLLNGRKSVILTEHGRHYPDHLRPKRAVLNQLLTLVTAAYTGVSEFTRQSLVSFEKMPAGRIEVIYNGIWLDTVGGNRLVWEAVRSSLQLQEKDLLVLSIGRMDPIKDFGTLIRAFAPVATQFPQARLWIVGGGNNTYQQELEKLVADLNLQGRVSLLGSRRDIDELLLACDLFVLPSITEAASMTILEAMSAGRTVLATRTGGNPELVLDGESGLLFDVGDVSGLTAGLCRLLGDSGLRSSMGKSGAVRVREKFSMDHILKKYHQLYQAAGSGCAKKTER